MDEACWVMLAARREKTSSLINSKLPSNMTLVRQHCHSSVLFLCVMQILQSFMELLTLRRLSFLIHYSNSSMPGWVKEVKRITWPFLHTGSTCTSCDKVAEDQSLQFKSRAEWSNKAWYNFMQISREVTGPLPHGKMSAGKRTVLSSFILNAHHFIPLLKLS